MTEEGFLRAIIAAPEDLAARHVYADWLEERCDDRAAFLRQETQAVASGAAWGKVPADLDPEWVALITTLGRPFQVGKVDRSFFNIAPEDMPFTEPIGMRGQVFVFQSQFRNDACWDDGLMKELGFLTQVNWGQCSYGAADIEMHPFLCELPVSAGPLTGAEILKALKARHFRSQHIRSLAATYIPAPGYHPGTENDEIHNDFVEQHLFPHTPEDIKYLHPGTEETNEYAGTHGLLKRHVTGGHLWYVLLHPTRHDGFADYVVLFAVGRSPFGNRLVGVVTHQVCHNLCD